MLDMHIEDFNKEITTEEGKIYFHSGKGYTSKLVQRLRREGFYVSKQNAVYCFSDKQGKQITSAFSWERLLVNIAKIMG